LPGIGLVQLVLLAEWLGDLGEAAFSAANKKEPSVFGDHECENWLDDVARRNVDPLQGIHERQFSNYNVAFLRSIDESLQEVRILNDLRINYVRAVFVIGIGRGGLPL